MKLEEHFEGTKFEYDLAKALLTFVPRQFEEALKDSSLEYEKMGTYKERKLKTILHYFTNFYTVLQDLELTLLFLRKERALILEHYSAIESQKTYYNYHFENYFIRLVTLGDIVARLGSTVYGLNIDLKKLSIYNFKDKIKKEGYYDIAVITDKLIQSLDKLKKERNNKLHSGKADIDLLSGTVIWEDYNKIIGSLTTSSLKNYTDMQVKKAIKNLHKESIAILDIIKELLEKSTDKLNEIIKSTN
ncbi:Cthe_2314 family HEPN domain-containing protein [Rufibacter ruber]|uniref:Cthe_2314 family HEPN domain-containing protein n=1 Tax=Rufibacter ruber TaxID=1783499 RepID=UPI00082F2E21|nr:Cthe_2314 family HEPN domain-containing protein [Rufibacter ruber]